MIKVRNDEKLPYDNAKIDVVLFSGEDVISTSNVPNTWENVDPEGIYWV